MGKGMLKIGAPPKTMTTLKEDASGQTSAEAKREVEQTRAHLGETLEALQLRAKRNLDIKTQLQPTACCSSPSVR